MKRDKEKAKAIAKICYNRNKEHYAAKRKVYYEANKEKIAAKQKEHYEANKYLRTATTARRRARKLQATPLWHEERKIKNLYELALKIRDWGCDVNVDHIVPLKNSIVCGLHCISNLQILTARANDSKGNKFEGIR